MINLHLNTGTGIESIQPPTKGKISLPSENSTFIELPSFTIIPNLNFVTRSFIENLIGREIRYSEILDRIERFKKLFEIIEKDFVGLENLRRELTHLSKIYTFRNPPEVSEFLSSNIFLIPLIEEAYRKIREYFPQTELILEVLYDPEADNKELVIFIHTNLPPDEALNKLEQLDKNWWLDASLEAEGRLCIHMEFE